MDKKRILWLFNHTSLRKFELPLLIEMGYEVYCPKKFGFAYGDRSASVSYEYDESLSIPKDILDKLNEVDFYKKIDAEVVEILNKYFDMAFCALTREPFRTIIYKFKGAIMLHAFGLEEKESYASVLQFLYGHQVLSQIKKISNRFWFSQTYENLAENEPEIISRRALYMPLGLGGDRSESWTGGEKEIFFVGPKIKTDVYYRNVYNDFCENFGDIPHYIGGGQLIEVDDDNTVLGFQPRDKFEYNMKHLAAMYYHSREPRHLHYHPLEAVEYGMPLIFMSGGMLDRLGGESLPGRCKTIKEARRKLIKLSRGDKRLANRIIKSQRVLLDTFQKEYAIPYWKEAMEKITASLPNKDRGKSSVRRVAVILPDAYKGGVLDYSLRFCRSIKNGVEENNDKCEVTFVYPDNVILDDNFEIESLYKEGIELRRFKAEYRDTEWIKKYYITQGFGDDPRCVTLNGEVCILKDGMNDMGDFDYAFIMSDQSPIAAPIFLNIPHAFVAHDYIQHYVPGVISDKSDFIKMVNQRCADYVLVTSEPSKRDAATYAGLREDMVVLTPYMLESFSCDNIPDSSEKDYFVWSTNISKHKNHITALKALSKYYADGGKLDCYITGVNTECFESDTDVPDIVADYVKRVRSIIEEDENLKNRIVIKGNMPKDKYFCLLKKASFIFHPGYGDNGNASIYDAAVMGVPGLSSDYPAMRYFSDFIEAPIHYMNPFDVMDISRALEDMEYNCQNYKKEMPSLDDIKKADYHSKGQLLYSIVKEIADI